MNQNRTEILLRLPVQVVDHVANILADRPYKEVRGILDLIVSQANDSALQALSEKANGQVPPLGNPQPEANSGAPESGS